ncbi:hypothetical protein C3F00_040755, partial [Pseudomonas sp. MWU13-2860]
KLKNKDGIWHAISKDLGGFQAGDIVTATIRFKAPFGLSGQLFLGNANDPNAVGNQVQAAPGNDGWQTLTVTYPAARDGSLQVYLYNLASNGDSNAGVVYDNLRISSVQRHAVLSETFTGFDAAGQGWRVQADIEAVQSSLLQAGSQAQLAAFLPTLQDPSRDKVTRYVYDAAGRQ